MNNLLFYFRAFYLLVLLPATLFSGCSENRKPEEDRVPVKDDLGRTVLVSRKPERVLALSSSLTEMLFLICDEKQIVGRTHNCDYPPQALKKEEVSNYPIDYEKLLSLNPDLVFAKEGIISLEEAAKIESLGIPLYFQKYETVNDILTGIVKLGEVLNKQERAAFVADSIRREVDHLKNQVKEKERPSVLILISKEQIFVFGKDSYASDILLYAGAENAMKEIFNTDYPQITSEYILKLNPDILIGLKGSGVKEGDLFELYPELKRLAAYQNKRYYAFPEDLLSRPGPRIGETVRQLIKITHPDVQ